MVKLITDRKVASISINSQVKIRYCQGNLYLQNLTPSCYKRVIFLFLTMSLPLVLGVQVDQLMNNQ